eukprot:CAMPEP_0202695746 /NCGR_PEP_ID=MMETSP1385-20130828/9262_1 /ASSEMBLY_ACC=CAM_ASM_000861 /TAXON_ID=933848 /ORGANISM="Elphidium margaritaceum" /LENGTH=493 /DNA_ID=CAMNT_0049351823 /DNA_START=78 /DNA_END=1559 /DNA_ORIENTATION=-
MSGDADSHNVDVALLQNDVIFEGILERKSAQKMLGKHLWEKKYFKLSAHTLSIYASDKSDIVERVIRLSSMVSVNRSTKNDGGDLKDNRFDVSTHDETLNLRADNPRVCQQWIHFLSAQRKQHTKSIRNGLQSLTEQTVVRRFERRKTSRNIVADSDDEKDDDDNEDDDEDDEDNRCVEDDDHDDDAQQTLIQNNQIESAGNNTAAAADNNNGNGNEELSYSAARRMTLEEWAQSTHQKHRESQHEYEDDQFGAVSFQGFLIRRIGHLGRKLGEKLYFRLCDDFLEWSKVDAVLTAASDDPRSLRQQLNELHAANLLGTVAVRHIKSVEMASSGGGKDDDDGDEFIIVFSAEHSKTDWVMNCDKNQRGLAKKWVFVLQKSSRDARAVADTIKNMRHDEEEEEDEEEDDDDEGDESSDSVDNNTRTSLSKRQNGKNKKRMGGSIKALKKLINEETIEELKIAQNTQLKNSNMYNEVETNANPHQKCSCSCLCFK